MKKIVIKKIHACNKMNFSSNLNAVIRAILNPLFHFFFTKRFCTHQKHQKHKDATKQRHKTLQANKNKKGAQKHLRGKKPLICSFAFLCFFCARRKENRKKRKVSTMSSIGAVRWCVRPVWTH